MDDTDSEKRQTASRLGVETILVLLLATTSLSYMPPLSRALWSMPSLAGVARLLSPVVPMGLGSDPLGALVSALVVVLGAVFVLASLLGQGRSGGRVRAGIVVAMIVLTTVWATVARMLIRAGEGTDRPFDGMVQCELAMDRLLSGRNPYVGSYPEIGSCFVEHWKAWGYTHNVGADYFAYPPFLFLSSLAVRVPCRLAFGWYDQRLAHLLALLALVVVVCRTEMRPRTKPACLAILGLSPFLSVFFAMGYPTYMVLAWIAGAVLALHRRRLWVATVCVSLACLTKQFAVFLVPFYLLRASRDAERPWRATLMHLCLMAGVGLVVTGPFLATAFERTWKSLVVYNETLCPIRGHGSMSIGSVLLYFGLVGGPRSAFPFWAIQVFGFLPLVGALAFRQARRNTTRAMMEYSFFATLVFFVIARTMHGNYVGFVIGLLAFAYALPTREAERRGMRSDGPPVPILRDSCVVVFLLAAQSINHIQPVYRALKDTAGFQRVMQWLPWLAPKLPGVFLGEPLRWLVSAVIMLFATGYVGVGLFEGGFRSSRVVHRLKLALILLIVAAATAFSTLSAVAIRRSQGESHAPSALVQTERAVEYLAEGRNPYEQYYGMLAQRNRQWWALMGFREDPAARFLAVPPFLLVVSVPARFVTSAALGWYDQRVLSVVFLLVALLIMGGTPSNAGAKLVAIALVGLSSPMLVSCMKGSSAAAAILPLAATAWALARRRAPLAAAMLALAVLSDMSMLALAPFYLLWAVRTPSRSLRGTAALSWARLWPLVAVAVVVVGPFVVWGPSAVLSGLVVYPNSIAPIRAEGGGGLGTFLLYCGAVCSPSAAFPFGWIRLGLVAVMLIYLGWRQSRDGTARGVFENGFVLGLALLAFGSRTVTAAHWGVLFSVAGMGFLLDRSFERPVTEGDE